MDSEILWDIPKRKPSHNDTEDEEEINESETKVTITSEDEYECLLPLSLYSLKEESEAGPPYFPFSRIYEQPFNVTGPQVNLLLPGYPVKIKFLTVERKVERNIFSPYLYAIQVQHGNFKWVIHKRFNQIEKLHESLKAYTILLPVDQTKYYIKEEVSAQHAPKLPISTDVLISREKVKTKAKKLERYFRELMKYSLYRNHRDTMEFLQISPLSFVASLGHKGREGMVRIRSGGHIIGSTLTCIIRFLISNCRRWKRYWLITRDNFIVYINPRNGRVKYVLLMDSGFKTEAGYLETGFRFGIAVTNLSRRLIIDFENRRRAKEWEEHLVEIANTTAIDFTRRNRFKSYVPVRRYSNCCWFVDGCDYFASVADALEVAQEEIFIAGWWVTPEFHLKRPGANREWWRLDNLLKRKAVDGVRIFVLLYKELETVLTINSSYTDGVLSQLHPNIKILRHPDYHKLSVLLWAHHEKLVVVDQTYAFIGGLDLCFGRWDNKDHRLEDLGERHDEEGDTMFKGLSESEKHTVMARVIAESFFPVETRKIQSNSKWSKVKLSKILKKEPVDSRPPRLRDFDNKFPMRDLRSQKKWLGKQYSNIVYKRVLRVHKPAENLLDRKVIPRLPWHDVGAMVVGAAARDAARHFIQRWNATKFEKATNFDRIPWLLPKSYVDISEIELYPNCPAVYMANCQICRSVCSWSAGINTCEESIHNAYIECIRCAEHYIYIENQFFITYPPGDNNIYNGIWEALYNRILLAESEQQPFKVYIVIPMMPGFEGDITSEKSVVLRNIAHFIYTSVCRGPTSLLERLCDIVPDPTEYINFFSLRTYDTIEGRLVSEMVYIHSKLIIVDDNTVIIGSANLNDRSLLGRRDSELAIVITDYQTTPSIMGGKSYDAGKHAISLRKRIFSEHLGLKENDPILNDPISESFYKDVWIKTAITNTALHEKVFRCVPTNETTTYQELTEYIKYPGLSVTDPELARNLLKGIKGFLVLYPFYFLCEEGLKTSRLTIENLLPHSVFT